MKDALRLPLALLALAAAAAAVLFLVQRPQRPGPGPALEELLFSADELPPGCALAPPEAHPRFVNPTVSSERDFVDWLVSGLFEDERDRPAVDRALYAVWEEQAEVGLLAFDLATTPAAVDVHEHLAQDPPGDAERMRTWRASTVVALLWHDGVSPACWEAMQALTAEALEPSGRPGIDDGSPRRGAGSRR